MLDFEPESKRMRVRSLHSGVSLDRVKTTTGFKLRIADDLTETPPPTEIELHILRTQVDPGRYVLGRAG